MVRSCAFSGTSGRNKGEKIFKKIYQKMKQ